MQVVTKERQVVRIAHVPMKLSVAQDKELKDGRGTLLVKLAGMSTPTRKFGYWGNPKDHTQPQPMLHSPSRNHEESVQLLKDMEAYAGTIFKLKSYRCAHCGNLTLGLRDFVFRPLPNGAVYIWPEGFLHYLEQHKVPNHPWFDEMINDYKQGLQQGLWK